MITFLILYILSIICAIIYLLIKKFKKESMCCSCQRLKQYKCGCWKYRCRIYGDFDRAPEYCMDYCPREEKEQE